jgi:PAS domain S-box-containing protein
MEDIKMDYDKMTKEELIEEINKLKKVKSISREDRLKLEILKRVPFTMWACDRNFKIVLWTCGSACVYRYSKEDTIGKNYLELFVDENEREQSRRDCINVIDNDMVQKNFIATDCSRNGKRPMLATNVFRIWDNEIQSFLQAEVALDISNIDENIKEYHDCRVEWGKRRERERIEKEKTTKIFRASLTDKLDRIHDDKIGSLTIQERERENYIKEMEKTRGKEEANKLKLKYNRKNKNLRKALRDKENYFKIQISNVKTAEEFEELQMEISQYNTKSINEIENE